MTPPKPETTFLSGDWDSIANSHRFAHKAMAATFELVIAYPDARYARQAAWAAFDEVDRLEADLSRFIENSDISQINNLSANQPLQIGPAAFECLNISAALYAETNGAFDITIGSLLECWRSDDGVPRIPTQQQLRDARRSTGMGFLKFDQVEHTLQLSQPVKIDLGGIGKGYAVDRMARLLGDWSISKAIIHAGFSSVLALDPPTGSKGWPVTLSNPENRKQTLASVYLKNRALGGSGLQKGQHIIDPRTAKPVKGKLAAWACAADAATADGLSTAFMVMSVDEIEQYCQDNGDVLAMLIIEDEDIKPKKQKVLRFGPWDQILI